ncbi:uncharacterized protein LOC125726336 [Brienomyrus brachyistius]|uniref:uncharacterized protein LOC125726336 n=1 Tax=Brienomyrus brachyistius TaxID=42636 RepID=UPI0020B23457|nr:uncharacterized protein LOC125726336 [Brienomyrus brachyistius]
MGNHLNRSTEDHRGDCTDATCLEMKDSGSEEVERSCDSHFAEDIDRPVSPGDVNKHGSEPHGNSSLWIASEKELELNNSQVATGGDDLAPSAPGSHVDRLHVQLPSAQGKVAEEGAFGGSTSQPVSGYRGMEARIGQLGDESGDDSELRSSPVKRRPSSDSWISTNCDMVTLTVPESPTAISQTLSAMALTDQSKELRPDQEATKPVEDVNSSTCPQDHTRLESNQACLEIDLDQQWRSFEIRYPGTAATFTGTIMEPVPGMESATVWEMTEECDDQEKVFVCTIDEIFRVPQYSSTAPVSQWPTTCVVGDSEVTSHTRPGSEDETRERAAGRMDVVTEELPACETICPEKCGKGEERENLNVSILAGPCWQEGPLPEAPVLGGDDQTDVSLLCISHSASDSISYEAVPQKVFLNRGDEDPHGDLPQVVLGSDGPAPEKEPASFGGPLTAVTSDPTGTDPIHGVRALGQELASMIIVTAENLILSKEDHVACLTLDLHDVFFHAGSVCLGDVHGQTSFGHAKMGTTDIVCDGKGQQSADIPPSVPETSSECKEDLIFPEGVVVEAALGVPEMLQKCGESLETRAKWESSDRAGGAIAVVENVTVTESSAPGNEPKHSQVQVARLTQYETANHKNDLLRSRQLSSEEKRSTTLGDSWPAEHNRDKPTGAPTHKRPDHEAREERPRRVKEAASVLRDIWPERSGDTDLRLLCLLGHVTEDCSIVWSKDGAVLAGQERSTGDALQVSLDISEASPSDLGTYQCLLSGPHGEASSRFHLTAEVLSELLPPHSPAQVIKGIREDVKCAPLLFREDFLREQYFGEHEAASIITEGVHFGEGMHRRAFRTKLLDGLVEAFRPGQSCVLKVHNAISYGTKSSDDLVCKNYNLAVEECYTQNTAREYIKAYKEVAKSAEAFGDVPDIIPIYLVHRPSNDIPYATLEEELIGDFVKYSVRDGREVNLMRRETEAGQKCCAFQHWVFHKTEGNLLVTDMQGVGMKLTDVGIATCRKGYRGFRGNCATSFIDQFRALHQCNQFCTLLGLQSLQPTQPKARRPGNETKPTPKKRILGDPHKPRP